jgi:hypothetical protein
MPRVNAAESGEESVMARSNSRVVLGVVAGMALSASGAVWGAQETGKATGAAAGGTATGQFTVNGKGINFTSAVATATKDSFDSSKIGYTLVLSDVKGLPDKYGSLDKVTAGTLHYIKLTLGHDKSVYGAILYHAGFRDQQMTSAGNIKLEVEQFGPDVLAGKVYTAAPRTFEGATFQFTATFNARVEKEK